MEMSPPEGSPFNRAPPEIISKIFVAVLEITPISKRIEVTLRSSSKMPMLLCHVSSSWRQIAFTTPELWEHVCAFIPVYVLVDSNDDRMQTDQFWVSRKDLEFLDWWSANLMQGRNAFSLRLHLHHFSLPRACKSGAITLLTTEDMTALLKLAGRARYMDVDSSFFPFSEDLLLTARPNGETYIGGAYFFFLESLVITEGGSYKKYDRPFQRIPFHSMQALRKMCLTNLSLHDPLGMNIAQPGVRHAFGMMWARLTHVQLNLHLTVATWQTFIRGCTSLESGRLRLFLLDGEGMDTDHDLTLEDQSGPNYTSLPNIRELSITIEVADEESDIGKLFDNLHLPSLKTLLVWCNFLTIKSFHRLLNATPNVERIRLSSLFPAVNDSDEPMELSDPEVDGGYYLHFPEIGEKKGRSGQANGRLVHYVPHLKKIMLDVPNTRQFKTSVRGYLDNMVRSGWLKGPWKNGRPQVEFYWIWLPDRLDRWPVIQDLKRCLADGVVGIGDKNAESMDIRARVKYDLTNYDEEEAPLWKRWFRLEAEF
ncbi:hypothetical protein M413DRAFT_428143 [Hebeloma cylindrosporum]|uniref:Uncharacterized protein n=1 Tax=Hebeloma cylindrosporum TaxID=76867 RepID=A0A0C2XDF5_HEBCY|nr:hypothetical protein M413DRAFT_428143 [Hebeloma cylindrosporum h7]